MTATKSIQTKILLSLSLLLTFFMNILSVSSGRVIAFSLRNPSSLQPICLNRDQSLSTSKTDTKRNKRFAQVFHQLEPILGIHSFKAEITIYKM